jgi:hypothetical protein
MGNTEIHPSESKSNNQLNALHNYLDMGYTINLIDNYCTTHDEYTRFVIVEKYPEKQKWTEEGEILFTVLNVNFELIPPPQKIELNITINKDGTIKPRI